MTSLVQRALVRRPPVELATGALGVVAVALAMLAARWPVETLVGAGALLLVAVCIVKVEVALLLLIASAPLELSVSISSNPQLSITKLAGALCFSAFALNALSTRRRLVFDRGHGLVLALLAIALLSMIQAREIPAAVQTTTRYASFVALFVVVSQFVGAHALQARTAWVLSIGSSVTGVLAMIEFLSERAPLARLPNGDQNDIAFTLATTLPLTLWLLRERGPRRAIVMTMIGIISLTILLTYSRGALVGLGMAALWKVVVERRHVRAILASVFVGALAFGVAFALQHTRIEQGLEFKQQVAAENVHSRLTAWYAAAEFAAEEPLLGLGPGNYQFNYLKGTDQPAGQHNIKVVHNAYLDIAAELGIVALFLFLAYLATIFARLVTADREGRGPPGFASVVLAALIVAIFSSITLSEQYFAPFWLLGGLATALWQERRQLEPA